MQNGKRICILGAGLSGTSLAYYLKKECTVIEKENTVGGLCRSYNINNICYDIGPHIIFSKNERIMAEMVEMLGNNVSKIKRSNQIFMHGKMIKYPFENNLYLLPEAEKQYCVNSFLNNPYQDYVPCNMLNFFLKIFGEDITNIYLRPYNEKIWKFDPSYMDLQMVDRIPKPPKEDILSGAEGNPKEGYTHQLYFYYPKINGIQSIVEAYKNKATAACFKLGEVINAISKKDSLWCITTNKAQYIFDTIISTLPVTDLLKLLQVDMPSDIKEKGCYLKYNSLITVLLSFDKDNIGDNFALNFPDKNIIFHRLSKLNSLGDAYSIGNSSTLLAEISYRSGDLTEKMNDEEILSRVVNDLQKLSLVPQLKPNFHQLVRTKYAYVIYDIKHKENTSAVKEFLSSIGIHLLGRFSQFEYINMDKALELSKTLSLKIVKE